MNDAVPVLAPRQARQDNRLGMIEVGRAIAALAVVLFHVDTIVHANVPHAPSLPLLILGERGVDFFFVLSGFIITFVHASDIGRPEQTRRFVLKRLVRIYPLLWLIAGANVALNIAIDHELYPFMKLWTSFTLWPSLYWPSPAAAWTLRHEMLFYTFFAIVIVSRRIGFALAGAALAATLWQTGLLLSGRSMPGLAAMLFSPLNLQFATGCLVAWAFRRFDGRHGPACLIAGLAALAVCAVVWPWFGLLSRHALDYQNAPDAVFELGFAVIFGLIVYGLADASRRVRVPGFLLLLGAASYAIYLVHAPVMGLAGRLLVKLVPAALLAHGAGQVVLALTAIVAGVATHLVYEKPIGRWLARRLLAGPAT
ncbi:MAG: acyltransferase [Novosphingobium sp.]|nr:acyltransferase [Novosphingobium sp.]